MLRTLGRIKKRDTTGIFCDIGRRWGELNMLLVDIMHGLENDLSKKWDYEVVEEIRDMLKEVVMEGFNLNHKATLQIEKGWIIQRVGVLEEDVEIDGKWYSNHQVQSELKREIKYLFELFE